MHILARRAAGWLWLLAWGLVLVLFVSPWSDLGGLVSERLRWWVRFGLGSGLLVGCTVGALARGEALARVGLTHARLLRYLLWPQAAVVAALLVVLQSGGRRDVAGAVVVVLLGYACGLDVGFGAWPLMCGRHYSFLRAIDAAQEPVRPEEESSLQGW